MDHDQKHTAKSAQEFLKTKMWDIPHWPVTGSQPSRACCSLTEDETEGTKTHKQAAAAAKHLETGNPASGPVH